MATTEFVAPHLQALKKELLTCTRCGFCRIWDWKGVDWVCPTYPYTEAFDTQYARGRVSMAQQYLAGSVKVDAALPGAFVAVFAVRQLRRALPR